MAIITMKYLAVVFLFCISSRSWLSVNADDELNAFRDYKVYEVTHSDPILMRSIRIWENSAGIDFWKSGKVASIMVHPDWQVAFEDFLISNNFDFKIMIENVQETLIREEEENNRYLLNKGENRETDFEHFWKYDEIMEYVEELAKKYPKLVQTFDIGTTYENRTIKGVTISKNGEITGEKPVIFIDGGIHAREWIAPMTVLHLIYQLVENSEKHSDMLENTDWAIIPSANPDGYSHSHSAKKNRFWRKNRSQSDSQACVGVDLNRNFGYMWEPSSTSCTDTYSGPSALSEAEAQAIDNFMNRFMNKIKIYLAVHSFGEYILYPWGYDNIKVPNWVDHQILGERAQQAIVSEGGGAYTVGNAVEVLYAASGASDDYAYGVHGVPLAYTLELTGGGILGFDLPASKIKTVASQVFEAFRIFALHAGKMH